MNTTSLEQRIERLERGARQWRAVALVLLIGIGAAFGIGAGGPPNTPVADIIRSHRIELVNDDGKVVGIFSTTDGAGGIMLKSKDGKPGISMTSVAEGSVLQMQNANGAKCLTFFADGVGGGSIAVCDKAGRQTHVIPADKR